MKNYLSVFNHTVNDNKASIKSLEEIIKVLSNIYICIYMYTKLEDTVELKDKFY